MNSAWLKCLALLVCLTTNAVAQKKSAVKQSIEDGKQAYLQFCVSCHQLDGLGVPTMNPPLAKTSFVSGDKKILIGIILHGMSRQEVDGQKYHNVMPPFDYLTDKQIAEILTYVRSDFGNKSKPVTEGEVKTVRESGKK